MANITELQLQGDSTIHKLNDARITTTAVTTATHILTMTTNNGETSIAPITAANLASVLGAQIGWGGALQVSADNIYTNSSYYVYGDTSKDTPTGYGTLITQCCSLYGNYGPSVVQTFYDSSENKVFSRIATSGTWTDWGLVTYPFQDYTTLSGLASALDSTVESGSADANTIAAGLHFCGDNVSNTPEPYGMLLTFQYSSVMIAQFFFPTNNYIYYRYYAAGQWDAWNKLQP